MCLLRSYFQVSKLTSDFYDAEAELKNLIQVDHYFRFHSITILQIIFIFKSWNFCSQRIYTTESRLSENDPLKYYMEKICSIIPTQFQKNNLRTSSLSSVNSPLSKELLVQYHKQVSEHLAFSRSDPRAFLYRINLIVFLNFS